MKEPDHLAKMGAAGRKWVEQFEIKKVLGDFEKELLKVVAEDQERKAKRKTPRKAD